MKEVYCLKDMKRLRNTVFLGEGSKQSHISKIQKRAEYLENNLEYIRGFKVARKFMSQCTSNIKFIYFYKYILVV